MRYAFLIFLIASLAAIAVGMVHIRRLTLTSQHQIQKAEDNLASLRRSLWLQERELADLSSPVLVRNRAIEMALIPADGSEAATLADANAGGNWH